ncbi:MAG TPA: serine hydrolase domain-containing protein [Longimicrobium sp.]|nr:serine hydrolase domain-containing protein [Longimicrobium sp.]
MRGARIHRLSSVVILSWALGAGGRTAFAQPAAANPAALTAELQRIITEEVAANPGLPGELLHVHAPAHGLDVSLAAGVFDRKSGRPLDPHHAFRVASVTKTFTAASILRLMEEGRLGLDDPVSRHLPADYVALLRADGYAVEEITIRHLLMHTSGIHDYATDQRYFAAVFGDPVRRWTRMEQVRAAMEWGQPRFAPGAGYHYSDTGYVLLGEIIERLTGQPMGQAFRTLIGYERLGLDETWLESLEPAPAGVELSHPYFQDQDAFGIDASVDLYGGGGLASSVEDLARFYRALLRGEVFERPSTLQAMLTIPPTNQQSPGGPYGMGIQRRMIGGHECWGHTGFWGTAAHHCPGPDVTIVRHYNQAETDGSFIFRALYDRVVQALGISR